MKIFLVPQRNRQVRKEKNGSWSRFYGRAFSTAQFVFFASIQIRQISCESIQITQFADDTDEKLESGQRSS